MPATTPRSARDLDGRPADPITISVRGFAVRPCSSVDDALDRAPGRHAIIEAIVHRYIRPVS
jgi:hypothetical protein